jgi:hypothetical protein
VSTPEQTSEVKSSVKIAMNSKGLAQTEVKAYDGVTKDEMDRLATLALETFNSVRTRLGAMANFS